MHFVQRAGYGPNSRIYGLNNQAYGAAVRTVGERNQTYGAAVPAHYPPQVASSVMARGRLGQEYNRDSYFDYINIDLKSQPKRKVMNIVSIILSLVVPCVIFCLVFHVIAFSLHFRSPSMCYVIIGLVLALLIFMGYVSVNLLRKAKEGHNYPTWFIFAFITGMIAWFLAVTGGEWNYLENMLPAFTIENANIYLSVDTLLTRGQTVMDGGRYLFVPGTRLDQTKAMNFKTMEAYCVVPIVGPHGVPPGFRGFGSGSSARPTINVTAIGTTGTTGTNSTRTGSAGMEGGSYEFWAVGKDCCTSEPGGFRCGEYDNTRVAAGLRLLDEEDHSFYRLAVQQAEAFYNIQAPHPIFLEWLKDPMAKFNLMRDTGRKMFWLGAFSHFVLQLFFVLVASAAFSKLGHF